MKTSSVLVTQTEHCLSEVVQYLHSGTEQLQEEIKDFLAGSKKAQDDTSLKGYPKRIFVLLDLIKRVLDCADHIRGMEIQYALELKLGHIPHELLDAFVGVHPVSLLHVRLVRARKHRPVRPDVAIHWRSPQAQVEVHP